ncbi:MAG: bifunctional phosphoribosylaminoimidazolecarboxamide formyltransferase/IMP cyclohydrolase [Magnetococcales bacterium]|nr:bifunctional phosphoribosylaminoimidazolecarboxamide formyltransferase/IMP cyclohydrolase [Magnetococcales bacterium]NGZ27531.1 bifunctional phosphoribosylaminoimidazolecarboxamide formyltransferase/IMP cyclohydrolase [Magnetococcales bacterium]
MALIKRALISVSDKTGLTPFCMALAERGVTILSTGGTAALLRQNNIAVTEVADFTGFPEMLDGRVKTLHPRIHGGLLGVRDNPEHAHQMAEHGIEAIDMVVVNLYPFEATVAKPGCTLEQAIENIDIGGPSMLRSAAKNHRFVTVITDPADYALVMEEMAANDGAVSEATNARLAKKTFARTAAYDGAISNWLSSLDQQGHPGLFPDTFTMQVNKVQEMRYGENPHQIAAFYVESKVEEPSVSNAKVLQGKALSFNNINDANGAFELVREFDEPTAVIVKHTNPCGVCSHEDLVQAYLNARAADPTSAFGGILAFNRPVEAALAKEITTTFVEAVIAPGYSEEARAIFAAKTALRLLEAPKGTASPSGLDMKRVVGGLLLQQRDLAVLRMEDLKVVTKRAPSEEELRDLLFAWKVVKHVKSNAIVYVKDLTTVGVGAGQMSRVDSSRIAVWKAQETAQAAGRLDNPITGTVLASDAFFPFRDGVDAAAKAGAKAVIQPGGSVRDGEVIEAADEHGMAMVFTGYRHFRH